MTKSLIGDGLLIGDRLFYPTWINVCSHSQYNVTKALGHYQHLPYWPCMKQRPPTPIGSFVHMMVGISHPMVECVLTIVHFYNGDHFLGLV
jgi:hypothetical protein